jgi:hypothetical protein
MRKTNRVIMTKEPAQPRVPALRFPPLYPKQHAAIMDPARYSIIEASTKTGKSQGCLCWIISRAWDDANRDRNREWVSPVYPQAKTMYRRACAMLRTADPKKEFWDCYEKELFVQIKHNGACVWFKGSDNADSLYGDDMWDVVIDESTRCRDEAWSAVRSTLTFTQGSCRIIGNVKGRKNWAYKLAQQAKAGDDPDLAYHKLTAWDAVEGGILERQEVEDAQKMLPPDVFRELYLAEPTDDGGNPFGMDAIARCVQEGLAPGPVKCYGVDLAKSVDWTVVCGLNAAGDVCYLERWRGPWSVTIPRLIKIIGKLPALIDATGVGDPIVENLQGVCPYVEGFKYTPGSKQQLMECLALALQQNEVHYPEGWLREELESFEYEHTRYGVRFTCPSGMHDDGVNALALARFKFGHGSLAVFQATDYGETTLAA